MKRMLRKRIKDISNWVQLYAFEATGGGNTNCTNNGNCCANGQCCGNTPQPTPPPKK